MHAHTREHARRRTRQFGREQRLPLRLIMAGSLCSPQYSGDPPSFPQLAYLRQPSCCWGLRSPRSREKKYKQARNSGAVGVNSHCCLSVVTAGVAPALWGTHTKTHFMLPKKAFVCPLQLFPRHAQQINLSVLSTQRRSSP